MAVALRKHATPEAVYEELIAARRGDSVEETLARILASWSVCEGAMPEWLGLGESGYRAMMAHHFPYIDASLIAAGGRVVEPTRSDEMEDLRRLLQQNGSGVEPSQVWMVDILIAGCMGANHLWEDLVLWCRADLSKMMNDNFAPLAQRNDRDMKWKKFLYKQLCESEGIYVCRAPSCEVCADYQNCFGPED